MRRVVVLLAVVACTTTTVDSADPPEGVTSTAAPTPSTSPSSETGEALPPEVPQGPLDAATEQALDALVDRFFETTLLDTLDAVVAAGDIRAAWVLTDFMRFYQGGPIGGQLAEAFITLTAAPRPITNAPDFVWASNRLISWDIPAWDGYSELKRRIYTVVDQGWAPFFEGESRIDWRLVTWGGVFADDRPLGDNGPCSCIPSLDDPVITDAEGGSWFADDRIVFGVVVNGEALALPKHQMEVHEMVNLTLGGRHLGIPYCTLCGSGQAYFTDNVPEVDQLVLRTSGLLSRSNKVMFDLVTMSVFDTFTGRALSGPLGETGVVLEQVSVVGSTWGHWKEAHPDTGIIAEDAGLGFVYPDDPLGSRDDQGPIFPVGDIDPRLPVQELVVGVIAPDGTPIAFPVSAVRERLAESGVVEFLGLSVAITDGIRVFGPDGDELTAHQAYWFAWSQFHEGTLVWTPFS